jgi:class 3 adenylate cyclase/tetratricopeptide (TPR) repeat protein
MSRVQVYPVRTMQCPSCSAENPPRFRFCGSCGAPLERLSTDLAEERKLVTALFCDVANFTQRAADLDPEDVRRLLKPYYASLRAEIQRLGGTVEKFIGDAVFALFGAPRAHEDDPERGVRAALAIRDAVADLNEMHTEFDLHIRIGITTGQAFVALEARPSQGEGMAWGDVLNTASRLQQAAPVDGILVDEATHRSTEPLIEYREIEPILAKGKTEPIQVWQALAPRSRRGLDLAEGSRVPLVSREEELTALVQALARVRTEREPWIVTLIGPPGIGKSRLVFELFRIVEQGEELIFWRQGRSVPYGGAVTFGALGEMVKAHAGILESDASATVSAKLRRAVAGLPLDAREADRIERSLRPLVGLAAEGEARGDQREAAFAAWRLFFEALARQRPLVLVFEDLHSAGDDLLDFIEQLVSGATGVPLLVVCSSRPDVIERRRDWGGRPRSATLSLSQLSAEETASLVASMDPEGAVPASVCQSLIAASDGNPLYAVEYMRMLADRGLLRRDAHSGAPQEAIPLPMPASLHSIIAARLDALPAPEKTLLQDASVVGKVVWVGSLVAIGGSARRTVERRLRTLERMEFVRRIRQSSVAGEPEYAFRHALVSEVAYGQIPRLRRSEAHRRAAEWLESLGEDRAPDRAELLSHHYVQALELARSVGEDTRALTDRARLSLRTAGGKALALYAYSAAANFYRVALGLWPTEDAERPKLLFRLGEALFYAETSGGKELAAARDDLLRMNECGLAAEAESLMGYLAYHRGAREEMFAHVRRAVQLVQDLPATRSKAEVLVDMAGFLVSADESSQAVPIAQQVLRIAEELDLADVRAHALGISGAARCRLGELAGRVELERCIALSEEIDSPLIAFGYGNLADFAGILGDLRESFELQAKGRFHADRFGHAGFVGWLAAEQVAEHYWSGRWDQALSLADELLGETDDGSSHFMEGRCRELRGRIRLARGDIPAASADAERALDFGRDAKDLQHLYPALGLRAQVFLAQSAAQEASDTADEILALFHHKKNAYPASGWVVDLALVLENLGRGSELQSVVEVARLRTRWLDAASALAEASFRRAASVFAKIGALPEEATAQLRAAQDLRLQGRLAEAEAEAQQARSFFRRIRAERLASDAEELLIQTARH